MTPRKGDVVIARSVTSEAIQVLSAAKLWIASLALAIAIKRARRAGQKV
jgi:hypothetical protein